MANSINGEVHKFNDVLDNRKRFLERVVSGKTLESDACYLSDLMKEFVLINVPAQY